MTPAQHKTAAETAITTLATPTTADTPDDADQLVLEAHGHLAQSLGTGDHYTDADAAITTYAAARSAGRSSVELTRTARLAVAHAVLADR